MTMKLAINSSWSPWRSAGLTIKSTSVVAWWSSGLPCLRRYASRWLGPTCIFSLVLPWLHLATVRVCLVSKNFSASCLVRCCSLLICHGLLLSSIQTRRVSSRTRIRRSFEDFYLVYASVGYINESIRPGLSLTDLRGVHWPCRIFCNDFRDRVCVAKKFKNST
jgi:hypothetical protein